MDEQDIVKERIINKNINSFFDCLTDILLKYSNNTLDKSLEFNKYFSKYMICRYLSMSSKFINIVEYLNNLQQTLSNEQFYHLVYTIIPKQKTSFIKYIKTKRNKNNFEKENTNNFLLKNNLFDI